ncbi:STAS/SEC14 domain-containing protein [Arthrobacter zhaoguopingii]|uniref:DUF7793 family protein n=1 Tax=Arthrobacter zhaoguopingii TaxID=2681491 RepID=UPI00135B1325|nr:STAS/SEC14 domain-containing protein [Arthrobacter zhaoguopingii]
MPAQRIEGGKATVEVLPNGIIHLVMDQDSTVTTEDAESIVGLVDALAGVEGRPMLAEMANTGTVTRGARAVFAGARAASRIALLGSSPVDQVIANFYIAVNAPPCPTRFFTSPRRAVAWLQS